MASQPALDPRAIFAQHVRRASMTIRWMLVTVLLAVGSPVLAVESRVESIQTAVDASEWKEALGLAEEWVDEEPENAKAHAHTVTLVICASTCLCVLRCLHRVNKFDKRFNAVERFCEIYVSI